MFFSKIGIFLLRLSIISENLIALMLSKEDKNEKLIEYKSSLF